MACHQRKGQFIFKIVFWLRLQLLQLFSSLLKIPDDTSWVRSWNAWSLQALTSSMTRALSSTSMVVNIEDSNARGWKGLKRCQYWTISIHFYDFSAEACKETLGESWWYGCRRAHAKRSCCDGCVPEADWPFATWLHDMSSLKWGEVWPPSSIRLHSKRGVIIVLSSDPSHHREDSRLSMVIPCYPR